MENKLVCVIILACDAEILIIMLVEGIEESAIWRIAVLTGNGFNESPDTQWHINIIHFVREACQGCSRS